MNQGSGVFAGVLASLFAVSAAGQAPAQVVRPPIAQLWMDVSTQTMPGMPDTSTMGGMGAMPGMGGMPGAGGMGGMGAVPGMGGMVGMGGMAGGGRGGNNAFGNTRGMTPGRYVDIALYTQRKPSGTEGAQAVPDGTGLAPTLPLLPPRAEPRSGPVGPDEPGEYERPKGRILFYWGCGETVRPGQPRVLDFATARPEEWAKFMQGRAPRDRGARSAPGNALWPNEQDRRNFPANASLVGRHRVTGDGVPTGLEFTLGAPQDFMPAIALSQSGALQESIRLSWQPVSQARAYFLNAMGSATEEIVFWSSSELPDFGMGLMDFATPGNVDQWLKEKVLLAPQVNECAIPRGIFANNEGAMLRMIAYGTEANFAHPPRPADPKVAWEPQWAVRVRTKSTAMTMLGMDTGSNAQAWSPGSRPPMQEQAPDQPPPQARPERGPSQPSIPGIPGAADILKGILGR